MSLGDYKCGFGAPALDQRICGQRGTVGNEPHVLWGNAGFLHQPVDARHEGFCGVSRGRQYFDGMTLGTHLKNRIGESPPDIDSKSDDKRHLVCSQEGLSIVHR